ncbi:MAG: glycosyltransferase [Alphaproteobacteria bacterium]|nr:glycosyltransferase [Alphaproteobacteria bacterium]
MSILPNQVTIEEADVIFVTDLPRAALADLPRFAMYAGECAYLELSMAVLSLADDIPATPYLRYGSTAAQRWARNLEMYDRLFANDHAVLICHRAGAHAFGMLLTMAWRPNKTLLDYDIIDIHDAESGYSEIEAYFPSMSGESMLGAVARHSNHGFGASQPLRDLLSDYTPYTTLLPTGFPPDLFAPLPRQDSSDSVKLVWLGPVNSVEEAKEPLLAIECLSHLPEEIQSRFALHLIGHGALWDEIQKHIEPTNFSIQFHQRPGDAELAALLSQMSAGLCLPANTPEVLARDARDVIALLMAGLPVCTLKQAEAGRLVRDNETGFVAEGIDAFRDAVQTLISSARLRRKLGAEAARRAHVDFGYGIPNSRLGNIIMDTIQDGYRYDWWITPDSRPNIFREPPRLPESRKRRRA